MNNYHLHFTDGKTKATRNFTSGLQFTGNWVVPCKDLISGGLAWVYP